MKTYLFCYTRSTNGWKWQCGRIEQSEELRKWQEAEKEHGSQDEGEQD